MTNRPPSIPSPPFTGAQVINGVDYGYPTRYAPQWRAGFAVFQQGNPNLKKSSLTGGGFIQSRQYYGTQRPMTHPQAAPITSLVGGGQLPYSPPFLTQLAGGKVGSGAG